MRRVVLQMKEANLDLLNEQFIAALGGAYGGMHPREELAIFVDEAVTDEEILAVVGGHNPNDLSKTEQVQEFLVSGRALPPLDAKSTTSDWVAKVQWLEEEVRRLVGI